MINYFSKSSKVNDEALEKILQKKQRDISKLTLYPLLEKIHKLPRPKTVDLSINQEAIEITTQDESYEIGPLRQLLEELIPWKKGPFNLFGTNVDSEWNSFFKWKRIESHLGDLTGKSVLDVGCNNGYFLFKLLNHNPKLCLGIDPVLPCYLQFNLLNHFARSEKLKFELLGVEHLSLFQNTFDVILHMGILYHHRHPLQQLIDIREALCPGGMAIIETIGIPGEDSTCLFPEGNYANMPNVWFVPTLNCLINWCKKTKFANIEVISTDWQSTDEQRATKWCKKETSYRDALDPHNHNKTIEGHPAPERFCLKVTKKG